MLTYMYVFVNLWDSNMILCTTIIIIIIIIIILIIVFIQSKDKNTYPKLQ